MASDSDEAKPYFKGKMTLGIHTPRGYELNDIDRAPTLEQYTMHLEEM